MDMVFVFEMHVFSVCLFRIVCTMRFWSISRTNAVFCSSIRYERATSENMVDTLWTWFLCFKCSVYMFVCL